MATKSGDESIPDDGGGNQIQLDDDIYALSRQLFKLIKCNLNFVKPVINEVCFLLCHFVDQHTAHEAPLHKVVFPQSWFMSNGVDEIKAVQQTFLVSALDLMETTEFQSWIITPDKPEYWGQSIQQRTSTNPLSNKRTPTDPPSNTPQNQNNIAKEKVEIAEIITTSVAASFATAFSKLNITPPSTPTTSNGSASDPSRTSFKAEELGFFD